MKIKLSHIPIVIALSCLLVISAALLLVYSDIDPELWQQSYFSVLVIGLVLVALISYQVIKSTLNRRLLRIEKVIARYANGEHKLRLKENLGSDFNRLELLLNALLELTEHNTQMLDDDKNFSELMLDTITDGLITVNTEGEIIFANSQAVHIFGYEDNSELLGKDLSELIPPSFRTTHQHKFLKPSKVKKFGILNKIRDVNGLRKDGSETPVTLTIVQTEQNGQTYFSAVIRDLSESESYKRDIETLAYYEPLTGLLNVNGLKRQLQIDNNQSLTVCMIELNQLRMINDGYGYEFGDELLKQFAHLLRDLHLAELNVASSNAGRFVVTSTSSKEQVAAQLASILGHNMFFLGVQLKLEFYVGMTMLPDLDKFDEQLRYCRIALRNRDEDLDSKIIKVDVAWIEQRVQQSRLQQKLSEAIDLGNLYFNFQPKFDATSKKAVAAEALIRWQDGDNIISPGVFIPIAEKNHLMPRLDRYVIALACKTIRTWLNQNKPVVPVAINLSSRYLFLDSTISFIFEKLGEYNIPTHLLEIEVTEYGLIHDFDSTAQNMKRLQNAGVKLAIDDYGTGHSNLQTVSALPIQHIKIDQAFIKQALSSKKSKAILENITNLASSLKIELTAEGVETQEQFDYVKNLGVDFIQGYLLSKPLSQMDFEQLLQNVTAPNTHRLYSV